MLNNKGQSLVLFVIILPVLLLFMVLVIDVGELVILKQELNNISNLVLDYGLDNLDKDNLEIELERVVRLNKDDIDEINIDIVDEKIYIELNDNVDGIFSFGLDISIFDVKSSYVGYLENDEKKIERNK